LEGKSIVVSTFAADPPFFGVAVCNNRIVPNKGMITNMERACRVYRVRLEARHVNHDKMAVRTVGMSNDHPKMATVP